MSTLAPSYLFAQTGALAAALCTKPAGRLTCMPVVELQVKKGEVFVSETDTEVIPKLCKWIYHSLPERVPFSEVRPALLCKSML